MANQRRYEIYVGALFAAAMALLAWMALKVGAIGGIGPQIHAFLPLPDAAGIQAGASVQIAGFEVGRVLHVKLDYDRAVAELGIDGEVGIPVGVTGRVRSRSVLGEKYIELVPIPLTRVDGKVPAFDHIVDGAELLPAPSQVEIDELVQQAGALLNGIDFERLNPAIKMMVEDLYKDPAKLKIFFENLDRLIKNGADASEALTLAAQRVPATLDKADAALDSVRTAADQGTSTLRHADDLIAVGIKRMEEAKGLIADARTFVNDGDAAIKTLEPKAETLLDHADQLVKNADAMVDELRKATPGIQKIVHNFEQIDKWEVRRLLREEGILIRLHPVDVHPPDGSAECRPTADRTEEVVPKSKLDPSPMCTEASGGGDAQGGGAPKRPDPVEPVVAPAKAVEVVPTPEPAQVAAPVEPASTPETPSEPAKAAPALEK